jgi:hypothetical protein
MRLYLKKKTPDQIEFGIIYGGIAIVALCVGRLLPVLSIVPDCVFKGLTGVPCPTCGSTRSMVHLAHGDVMSAVAMNPLTALSMITALAYFIASIIMLVYDLPRVRYILSNREKNVMRMAAVMMLVMQWVYLIIQS